MLAVLLDPRTTEDERATESLVGSTRLGGRLRHVLFELRRRNPPLIESGVDGLSGQIVWEATAAGAAAMADERAR